MKAFKKDGLRRPGSASLGRALARVLARALGRVLGRVLDRVQVLPLNSAVCHKNQPDLW